ncbi:MAG: hypothetical protein ABIQ95_11760, partial [Bdellovibrionia bacterium]
MKAQFTSIIVVLEIISLSFPSWILPPEAYAEVDSWGLCNGGCDKYNAVLKTFEDGTSPCGKKDADLSVLPIKYGEVLYDGKDGKDFAACRKAALATWDMVGPHCAAKELDKTSGDWVLASAIVYTATSVTCGSACFGFVPALIPCTVLDLGAMALDLGAEFGIKVQGEPFQVLKDVDFGDEKNSSSNDLNLGLRILVAENLMGSIALYLPMPILLSVIMDQFGDTEAVAAGVPPEQLLKYYSGVLKNGGKLSSKEMTIYNRLMGKAASKSAEAGTKVGATAIQETGKESAEAAMLRLSKELGDSAPAKVTQGATEAGKVAQGGAEAGKAAEVAKAARLGEAAELGNAAKLSRVAQGATEASEAVNAAKAARLAEAAELGRAAKLS